MSGAVRSKVSDWNEYDDKGDKLYTVCYVDSAVATFEPCTTDMAK